MLCPRRSRTVGPPIIAAPLKPAYRRAHFLGGQADLKEADGFFKIAASQGITQ
jgi:hypothetical protein